MSTGADELAAIESVLIGYAEAVDQRRWDRFDTVFAPDVETTYSGGVFVGVPATVAYLRSNLGGCGPTQHLLGNIRIRLNGNTAHSDCALRAWHAGAGDLTGEVLEVFGHYHDELRTTADGWRITRRRLEVVASIGCRAVLRP